MGKNVLNSVKKELLRDEQTDLHNQRRRENCFMFFFLNILKTFQTDNEKR